MSEGVGTGSGTGMGTGAGADEGSGAGAGAGGRAGGAGTGAGRSGGASADDAGSGGAEGGCGAARADLILHLTERPLWDEARAAGNYEISTRGRTLGDVGFIHCSLRHQLPAVAALLYGAEPDRTDLVVLVIDVALLDVPVRYEPPVPGAEEYPHVYGPLPVAAVVGVEPWPGDAAGA